VRGALAEAALPAELLCLEVTESVLTQANSRAPGVLQTLHDAGVKIAIDDFGTGNASLAHLKRFPVDQLKIDATFVAGLGYDTESNVIVAAVIGLAHALGVTAVAESVEQQAQLDELRALHCDTAQGYLFARPGDAAKIDALLAAPVA
jgi:EAL domain-containing protein (putative c-di-GMP-specific phosphodiesterase class I)